MHRINLIIYSRLIATLSLLLVSSTVMVSSNDAYAGASQSVVANVISIEVSGSLNAYRFSVGINSPDTGCRQYADWWEVISEQGALIYRRILLHSHSSEQPFVRSGGPVAIAPDTTVIIRAHMNKAGYGGVVFKGTVQGGFNKASLPPGFAADIEKISPQPDGCAF